jgi:Holliday junction resolvase RusA-like endonuclease
MLSKKGIPVGWPRETHSVYEIYIELFPPSNNRYDVDNRLKVLLDSLVYSKIISDDSQIHKLIVVKKSVFDGGKSVIVLKEINNES